MLKLIQQERICGALWGALVGNALGVPVEFQSRDGVRKNPVTDMQEFGTHHQPAGTWSDDSSLLLCTVASLAACAGLDIEDLAERLMRWEAEGYWTPHGTVFDIGIVTSQVISRLARGVAPQLAGGDDEYSNGNGSLMRILPIALWFGESPPDQLASYTHHVSSLTHRHPRSQMACALYCLIVRELLNGAHPAEAVGTGLNCFRQLYKSSPFVAEQPHFQPLETAKLCTLPESEIGSSGYVMDTLTASIWCLLTSGSFEETVLKAVNLGGDTDTTGTAAGGLAGACYGVASIPAEWQSCLARHDDVAALFAEFVSLLPCQSAAST